MRLLQSVTRHNRSAHSPDAVQQSQLRLIPISDDLRNNLAKPLDPRVKRILSEIAEAEQAQSARRIIPFPFRGAAGHLVRDSEGNLVVLPGHPPVEQFAAII